MCSPRPGGQLPIRSDIALGARAATRFAGRRDVPDVLGFADYADHPDLTLQAVHARILADTLFVDHRGFPLPKADGGTRGLTVISPIAEFALRTYVGRCAAAISAAVDEGHVLNGLIRRPGPGWFSADFKQQIRLRRQLQRLYYDNETTQAVGFLDVERFFPNCRHDWLGNELEALAAPVGAASVLVDMLSMLFQSGVGLPIGFEGSGPLANLFLRPLDEALFAARLPFVRWTDDVDVFLPDASAGSKLLELAEERLAAAHLRLNDNKSDVLEKGDAAEQRLLDPARDSILGGDAVENVKSRLDLHLWMKDLGETEELPAGHFRSFIGFLRAERDPGAIEYLAQTQSWIDREPRAVSDYLAALGSDADARQHLDPDLLLDLAVGRLPDRHTEAGQLHLLRALTEYRVDRSRSSRLLDFATRAEIALNHPVLGAWAVRAWSASQGWSRAAAQNVIEAYGYNDYRRAALIGFADRRPADARALHALARADPELAPAVAFALAA